MLEISCPARLSNVCPRRLSVSFASVPGIVLWTQVRCLDRIGSHTEISPVNDGCFHNDNLTKTENGRFQLPKCCKYIGSFNMIYREKTQSISHIAGPTWDQAVIESAAVYGKPASASCPLRSFTDQLWKSWLSPVFTKRRCNESRI